MNKERKKKMNNKELENVKELLREEGIELEWHWYGTNQKNCTDSIRIRIDGHLLEDCLNKKTLSFINTAGWEDMTVCEFKQLVKRMAKEFRVLNKKQPDKVDELIRYRLNEHQIDLQEKRIEKLERQMKNCVNFSFSSLIADNQFRYLENEIEKINTTLKIVDELEQALKKHKFI